MVLSFNATSCLLLFAGACDVITMSQEFSGGLGQRDQSHVTAFRSQFEPSGRSSASYLWVWPQSKPLHFFLVLPVSWAIPICPGPHNPREKSLGREQSPRLHLWVENRGGLKRRQGEHKQFYPGRDRLDLVPNRRPTENQRFLKPEKQRTKLQTFERNPKITKPQKTDLEKKETKQKAPETISLNQTLKRKHTQSHPTNALVFFPTSLWHRHKTVSARLKRPRSKNAQTKCECQGSCTKAECFFLFLSLFLCVSELFSGVF